MRPYFALPTSRVTIAVCCTALLLAAAACHGASPEVLGPPAPDLQQEQVAPHAGTADLQAAHDELIGLMLTPTAEIRLGPGLADQERLMRRSSSSALSYTVRSLWAGIVQYVFPPHGLFRRGDPLALVYDAQLLADLERARERMAAENIAPLTIASYAARSSERAESRPEEATAPPEAPSAVPPRAPDPVPMEPTVTAEPVEIPDFDFEANRTEQDQLREQAELTAAAVSASIDRCREALSAQNAAQEELADRHRLLEQGVLAEQALEPAEQKLAEARTAYKRAEATLKEAQEGYDRVAGRIATLEDEARAAHEAIQAAREAEAAIAEARARREAERREAAREAAQNPPEIRLERVGSTVAQAPDPADAADAAHNTADPEDSVRVYHSPAEMTELAAPRWEELAAEMPGLVSEVLVPRGAAVEEGEELLRVANLQLAEVSARVNVQDLRHFTVGRSISIAFAEYEDAVFGGWVEEVAPIPGSDEAEVRLLVVCQSGRFSDDPYLALRWMTLEAGVGRNADVVESLQSTLRARADAQTEMRLAQMFPTVGPTGLYAERAMEPTERVGDHFTGRLRLRPMDRVTVAADRTDDSENRLAALTEWRKTYIEGMTTTVLEDGTYITYPAEGDVSTAVRLMLEGRVNHRPNLCAATMREALGWGLGDAHQWATRLPRVGYVPREDGLPRPGDILVWPFTYGPNRSQHIGFAVRQGHRLMLLSNLSGTLGTTEILGGYIAFHKPCDPPAS